MEFVRVQKVIKAGNSIAICLPRAICVALKIERGDQVAFGVYNDNSILIRKLTNEELRAMRSQEIK